MLLRNSLYNIVESQTSKEDAIFSIRFDDSHPIFAGHFPGNPIVPGACLVQIAEELLSIQLAQTIHFKSISHLKFHKPITPEMEIAFKLSESNVVIGNTDLTEIYAQFKATHMCADSDIQ